MEPVNLANDKTYSQKMWKKKLILNWPNGRRFTSFWWETNINSIYLGLRITFFAFSESLNNKISRFSDLFPVGVVCDWIWLFTAGFAAQSAKTPMNKTTDCLIEHIFTTERIKYFWFHSSVIDHLYTNSEEKHRWWNQWKFHFIKLMH